MEVLLAGMLVGAALVLLLWPTAAVTTTVPSERPLDAIDRLEAAALEAMVTIAMRSPTQR